jgi:hypothetical protein
MFMIMHDMMLAKNKSCIRVCYECYTDDDLRFPLSSGLGVMNMYVKS